MNIHPAGRFEWERIVRRCLIPKQTKFVAFVLAQYGTAKGDSIHPGLGRLSAVCEMGESTVRRHMDALVKLGLVERVRHGGGPQKLASEYRLTIPEDLIETIQMLDVDERTALASVSAVKPRNSAHSGERSNRGNSAHSEPELRSLSNGTPLISGPNSAHPGERPSRDQGEGSATSHHGESPSKVTSPDAEYAAAVEKLSRLDDFGMAVVDQAPAEFTTHRDRIVWAAKQMTA